MMRRIIALAAALLLCIIAPVGCAKRTPDYLAYQETAMTFEVRIKTDLIDYEATGSCCNGAVELTLTSPTILKGVEFSYDRSDGSGSTGYEGFTLPSGFDSNPAKQLGELLSLDRERLVSAELVDERNLLTFGTDNGDVRVYLGADGKPSQIESERMTVSFLGFECEAFDD